MLASLNVNRVVFQNFRYLPDLSRFGRNFHFDVLKMCPHALPGGLILNDELENGKDQIVSHSPPSITHNFKYVDITYTYLFNKFET